MKGLGELGPSLGVIYSIHKRGEYVEDTTRLQKDSKSTRTSLLTNEVAAARGEDTFASC